MKAVDVDEVLKILHKYGRYIFVSDEKKYSDMVDEIANLKALEQEPIKGYCKTCSYFCDTHINKNYIDPHDASILRGHCSYHDDEYYNPTNEECYCSHWLKKRG